MTAQSWLFLQGSSDRTLRFDHQHIMPNYKQPNSPSTPTLFRRVFSSLLSFEGPFVGIRIIKSFIHLIIGYQALTIRNRNRRPEDLPFNRVFLGVLLYFSCAISPRHNILYGFTSSLTLVGHPRPMLLLLGLYHQPHLQLGQAPSTTCRPYRRSGEVIDQNSHSQVQHVLAWIALSQGVNRLTESWSSYH